MRVLVRAMFALRRGAQPVFTLSITAELYNWAISEAQAKEFLTDIVNLVSFNGCYVPTAFKVLVQGFIPQQKDAGIFYLFFFESYCMY